MSQPEKCWLQAWGPYKNVGRLVHACNPIASHTVEEDSRGSLASQSSLIEKNPMKGLCMKKQGGWHHEEHDPRLISSFYVYSHMCVDPHKYKRGILLVTQLLKACVSIFMKHFNRKLTKISCSNCRCWQTQAGIALQRRIRKNKNCAFRLRPGNHILPAWTSAHGSKAIP